MRIEQIIYEKRMTNKDFAAKIGVSGTQISDVVNGKANPGNKVIEGILKAFPNINSKWLMKGEEQMYIQQVAPKAKEPKPEYRNLYDVNELIAYVTDLDDQLQDVKHKVESLRKKVEDLGEDEYTNNEKEGQ